jgi:hypothetical protein
MSSLPHRPASKAAPSPATPGNNPGPLSSSPIEKPCTHPRVQIVAREEDSEFVECLECREIFEASEFKDMAIEESTFQQES